MDQNQLAALVRDLSSDEPEGELCIGVVEYPGSGPVDADDLLQRADQAMYRAKEEGKNRIVFAE